MKYLINSSVGDGGTNQMSDVAVIQRLLNLQKIPGALIPLKVDGRAGNKTISRITIFQKEVLKLDPPDGLVEPGGITFLTLLQNAQLKSVKSFSFSDDGLKLLEFMEGGARLKPYDDQTGKTITQWVKGATIGCGHLISKKKWPKYKDGITQDIAHELLRDDLRGHISIIEKHVTAHITQNEFDALVMFVFNIGGGNFNNSSVKKLINNPLAKTGYTNLEAAWKAWNKSQGKVMRGLDNRRKSEWNVFSKGVYETW